VNLALAVGRARESDGYHPIASWMARVDLSDQIMVTRLDDGDLSRYAIIWHPDAPRTSPIDWSITKDLAVRAHLLVQETLGRELPVQVLVRKRIPVGGGLAGGSADGAGMLLALNQLFELGLKLDELTPLAAKLGSDVAYCLHEGPAYVDDFGAGVTPVAPVRADAVVVLPEFPCPTGAVYRAFDASPAPEYREDEVRALASRGVIEPERLFNDLAAPACAVAPGLREVLDRVSAIAGAPAHVSGSGSTVLVIAESSAADLAERIEREVPGVVARGAKIGQ
jgi:4-diphosphocytidyl-2-C-methyl-D-erythritol kinase